jgi:hypothetical protein
MNVKGIQKISTETNNFFLSKAITKRSNPVIKINGIALIRLEEACEINLDKIKNPEHNERIIREIFLRQLLV